MNQLLLGHPNRHNIVQYMTYGWPISSKGDTGSPALQKNHRGAMDFLPEIRKYLIKEKQNNAILGPFDGNPFGTAAKFSPLNTRPKPDGSRRVILDLSCPRGNAVNDSINKKWYMGDEIELKFPTVDNLVAQILSLNGECYAWKRDLKSFYRSIPVCLGDIAKLGYSVDGNIYFDRVLPMGMVSSAFVAQSVSSSIGWIFKHKKGRLAIVYIDDFAGANHKMAAEKDFSELSILFSQLGVPESVAKAVAPTQRLTFLGILVDCINKRLEIDQERLNNIKTELKDWLTKERACVADIQHLVGLLSFAATCVRQGRTFFSRILDWLRTMPKNRHFNVSIPEEVKKDIVWWHTFAETYNGISMMPPLEWSKPDMHCSVDACLQGAGGYCQGQYFHFEFSEDVIENAKHINGLEIYTLMVACRVWGDQFRGKNIQLFSDNMATVEVFRSGKSADPFMSSCLRDILFEAASNEFQVRLKHLTTTENRLSDLLSRWSIDPKNGELFHKETAHVNTKEVIVPESCRIISSRW